MPKFLVTWEEVSDAEAIVIAENADDAINIVLTDATNENVINGPHIEGCTPQRIKARELFIDDNISEK